MENAKSFKDLYDELDIPAIQSRLDKREFIKRCAKVTKKSEGTVRSWLSGKWIPDALTQEALSNEFGIPSEQLFPQKNCVSDEK